MNNCTTILLIWNIVVMLIFGIDKMLAKKHKRRISESSLLTLAFLIGGVGAMFGMILFNHKTSKMRFRILVPIATICTTIIIIWLKINIHRGGFYGADFT